MSSGMRDRIYFSSGFETTAGAIATVDKRFLANSCSLCVEFNDTVDENITGYDNATGITRENYMASGDLSGDMNPDLAAYIFKVLFGAAPTSAQVSSSTVYEHTQNAFAATPKTVTFQKVKPDITNWTERWGGNGIKSVSIKGSKGRIQISAAFEGMAANYTRGTADPAVSAVTSGEGFICGINSELIVDGTTIADGNLFCDFEIDIDAGKGVLDTAGSSDGSHTAFDTIGPRRVTASFTLKETAITTMDELITGTDFSTYEFKMYGPIIDSGAALNSLVSVMLSKARLVGRLATEIGDKGVIKTTYKLIGVVNTSTGYDLVTKVRNLQTSY